VICVLLFAEMVEFLLETPPITACEVLKSARYFRVNVVPIQAKEET
jgi:hypothetical protein